MNTVWCSSDNGEGDTPVPIPNTEVKPLSADGTARETEWESRTSLGLQTVFFAALNLEAQIIIRGGHSLVGDR